MTQLFKINVKLSKNQKKNIGDAYHKRETIVIRLTNNSLRGNDTLYVPATVKKRLENNRKLNKGMDIKLAKTNIRKQVGGNLLTSILSLGRIFGPTIAKTMGLAALAGAASTGASQIVKKISGKGTKTGGFLIPQNKIDNGYCKQASSNHETKERYIDRPSIRFRCPYQTDKNTIRWFSWNFTRQYWDPMVLKALTGKGAPKIGAPKGGRGARKIGAPPELPQGGRGAPRMVYGNHHLL